MALVPVVDARSSGWFHAVPRHIYADRHPCWTPVIPGQEAALFDAARNAALRATESARWCVVQDGHPIARIAAFAPHALPAAGYIGFFEAPNDLPLARTLFSVAEDWLARRQRRSIFGPITINPRDQIGLLVEGFDEPATLLTPYNPPYYAELFKGAGYHPAVGLRSYAWRPDMTDRRGMLRVGERIAARGTVAIRMIDPRHLEDEARLIARLLNRVFAHVWGYPPVTDAEALDLARDLRAIVDPQLCLIAMYGGETVGVALTIPDANWLIRRINGRLFPFGWLTALRLRRRIPRARFMALGVLPGRATGTAIQLMLATHRALLARGYRYAELSQVFDDNHPMRRLLERMGCPTIKRYAVFERSLSGGGPA